MEFQVARALNSDVAGIIQLYQSAYIGTYPDKSFQSVEALFHALNDPHKYIFKATIGGNLVGCILFLYQGSHKIAKAGAAVVASDYRGHNLTQKMLLFGIEELRGQSEGLELLYITTRTVHKAAQVLTANLGFKQLGIFPNVHKTNDYETHALAAMYFDNGLEKRNDAFELHPDVYQLYQIVRENLDLPEQKMAKLWKEKHFDGEVPVLEVVTDAPAFIRRRYKRLKKEDEIDFAFFPFHTPNYWITSPNEKLEVFAYVNEVDKHCVITGVKLDREVSFTDMFLKVSNILRDRGIRYIEVIIRANRINILDKIIQAKFVPCGYLPAFQLEDGVRHDYVVFSRSFEVLDFNNLQLTGANEKYLRNYIRLWEKKFLGGYFKNEISNES